LLDRIQASQQARVKRLTELEPLLIGGDVGRGRGVFFGQKAACFGCHAIGREGGKLGPDLTAIGAIRSGRDLIEALIFPSASFVPGYEPYRIETKTDTFTGVIGSQTPEVVVLKTGANAEERIPRDTIRSITPGTVSIMPEGLDVALTREELLDLLAFLQAQNGDAMLQPKQAAAK
jgi:putative heme-binding domain-containing protein